MDQHIVEFVCIFVIFLLGTSFIEHTNLIEASLSINPSHNTTNASPFYKSNDDQTGTYLFAGYKMSIEKGSVGVYAKTTLWSPTVSVSDWSAALISIGVKHQVSFSRSANIELNAGWMVNPKEFNHPHPVIFASYKIDNNGWCYSYNPNCTGFVKTGYHALGSLTNTSVFGGAHTYVHLYIWQNNNTKNWLLSASVHNESYEIGYWRESVVSELNGKANTAMWGGKVYRSSTSNPIPMMGSGTFYGYKETATFRGMQVTNKNYQQKTVLRKQLKPYVTEPSLYKVSTVYDTVQEAGVFNYGGPNSETRIL